MGISVQSSGIKVEKNKYFLVNLNADPSLNELLVYYLKAMLHVLISYKSQLLILSFILLYLIQLRSNNSVILELMKVKPHELPLLAN